eukprot:1316567-Amorphochlora_amoeboformis.AAC.1
METLETWRHERLGDFPHYSCRQIESRGETPIKTTGHHRTPQDITGYHRYHRQHRVPQDTTGYHRTPQEHPRTARTPQGNKNSPGQHTQGQHWVGKDTTGTTQGQHRLYKDTTGTAQDNTGEGIRTGGGGSVDGHCLFDEWEGWLHGVWVRSKTAGETCETARSRHMSAGKAWGSHWRVLDIRVITVMPCR